MTWVIDYYHLDMHPSLFLQRLAENEYEALVVYAGEEVGPRTRHPSLATAISYTGRAAPAKLYRFMDVYLGSACIGTQSTLRMSSKANVVAKQLLAVYELLVFDWNEVSQGTGTKEDIAEELVAYQRSIGLLPKL